MAVSKRTRYEVLRRDNHTCRYCGGTAPDVTLTVDHVQPVALGGTDAPDNLVAACKDCNAGKTSTSPDAATVAQVSEDAVRWAKAIKAAANAEVRNIRKARKYNAEVYQAWESYMPWHAKLPDDWDNSVNIWRSMGLPVEVVTEAVYSSAKSQAPGSAKFRYMAKICWNRIREIQDEAGRKLGVPEPAQVAKCAHGCPDDAECAFDWEGEKCPRCGVQGCPYLHGWDDAAFRAWGSAFDQYAHRDLHHRMLESVIDRRPPRQDAQVA